MKREGVSASVGNFGEEGSGLARFFPERKDMSDPMGRASAVESSSINEPIFGGSCVGDVNPAETLVSWETSWDEGPDIVSVVCVVCVLCCLCLLFGE